MRASQTAQCRKIFAKNASAASLAAALLLPAALLSTTAAAWAQEDPYFSAGTTFFKKGNYKKALQYFQQSQKLHPYSADTLYYHALTSQRLGDTKTATSLYANLVRDYSYCDAGKLAATVLVRLDPEAYRQIRSGKSSAQSAQRPAAMSTPARSSAAYSASSAAELSQLPAEARIYFEHAAGGIIVDASVNNRPVKMIFDTGAEGCVFGKVQLKEMGITPPEGPPMAQGAGVGSSGTIDTWFMPVDLKVGTIERKNFRIAVHDNLPTPLLGQTFYRDFQYTIDNGSKNIHFVRKSARPATVVGDRNAVPFRRSGNNIIVDVDVNGHSMTMFLDTGANAISFTEEQARKAGLSIPDDAAPVVTTGVGGSTTGVTFPVKRMRLGPIEKTDIMVTTVGSAAMPYPLLGTPFFTDWEVTIDNENSVVRLVRR